MNPSALEWPIKKYTTAYHPSLQGAALALRSNSAMPSTTRFSSDL